MDRKGIVAVEKLLVFHIFNWIVLKVTFGLRSYEDIPLALSYIPAMYLYVTVIIMYEVLCVHNVHIVLYTNIVGV